MHSCSVLALSVCLLFGCTILLTVTPKAEALTCFWPCNTSHCPPEEDCPYGTAKDACYCCNICANGPGERCGKFYGPCGDGLECVFHPPAVEEYYDPGVCEPVQATSDAPTSTATPPPATTRNRATSNAVSTAATTTASTTTGSNLATSEAKTTAHTDSNSATTTNSLPPATSTEANRVTTPQAATTPTTPQAATTPTTPQAATTPTTPQAATTPTTPQAATTPTTPRSEGTSVSTPQATTTEATTLQTPTNPPYTRQTASPPPAKKNRAAPARAAAKSKSSSLEEKSPTSTQCPNATQPGASGDGEEEMCREECSVAFCSNSTRHRVCSAKGLEYSRDPSRGSCQHTSCKACFLYVDPPCRAYACSEPPTKKCLKAYYECVRSHVLHFPGGKLPRLQHVLSLDSPEAQNPDIRGQIICHVVDKTQSS